MCQTFYKDSWNSLIYWSLLNFVQEILSVLMAIDSIGVAIKVFIRFLWPHELNWFLFNFITFHLYLSIFGNEHWYFTVLLLRHSLFESDGSINLIRLTKECEGAKLSKILDLTHWSSLWHFILKLLIGLAKQIKWLVSIWNATLGWNGLLRLTMTLKCHQMVHDKLLFLSLVKPGNLIESELVFSI